jgi:hypothetical protein
MATSMVEEALGTIVYSFCKLEPSSENRRRAPSAMLDLNLPISPLLELELE